MNVSLARLAAHSALALGLAAPLAAVGQTTPPAHVHAHGAPAKTAPAAAKPAAKAGAEMHAYGAWVRSTPPGAKMTAAYVSFHNPQSVADRLLGASTPVAKRVELHETRTTDGVARMRRVEQLEVGADQAVKFAPGGLHLMLLDLTGALKPGQKVPLQLRFANAGTVEVQAEVRAPGADEGAAKSGAHAHH